MPGDFFRTIKDVCNTLSILSNWNFSTLLAFKMTVTVSSVSNLADLLQLIESNEPEQWQEIKNLIYEQYVRLVHKNVFFIYYSHLVNFCPVLSEFLTWEFCLRKLLIFGRDSRWIYLLSLIFGQKLLMNIKSRLNFSTF